MKAFSATWALGVLSVLGAVLASPLPAATPAPAAPVPVLENPSEAGDSPFTRAYREAFVAFKSQRYPEADAAADRAAQIDPHDARPLILKGRIAAAQDKAAPAEALLKQGLALQPEWPAAHRALGDFYFHQRRYAEARVAYLDAQRYGETDPLVGLDLFYCVVGLKDLGEAEKRFVTFNAFDEKVPFYYFAKAALARLRGNEAESRKDLQDATVLYGSQVFAEYARDYFFLFATKP